MNQDKMISKDGRAAESIAPVCPFCKEEMVPMYYRGYYESFKYWDCSCNDLPVEKDNVWVGQYA